MDENQGMELTEDNIETVLDEIRPYLVGMWFSGEGERQCIVHQHARPVKSAMQSCLALAAVRADAQACRRIRKAC